MVNFHSVDVAADSFDDLKLQVSFVFVTTLHPTLLLHQVIVGLLVSSAVGGDLIGSEVAIGILAPRHFTLHSIMVKVETDGLQNGLYPEHAVQHHFTVVSHDATILEGRCFILPVLHQC